MLIEELEHLMTLDPDTGIKRLIDGPAMNDRINEWFETPEGSMADNPAWGHNLGQFKHDPLDRILETRIKVAIFTKLPLDIRDIILTDVEVVAIDIYRCKVILSHQIGTHSTEVIL